MAADPSIYVKKVLGQDIWSKQEEICVSVGENQRTMVTASHGVGKSHIVGGLVNWHFDVFRPGVTLTTAPNALQVTDVLWKEVRRQRAGRPGLQPKAPRMQTAEDHFAVGMTAASPDAFQGRHEEHLMIAFDEAVSVDSAFWDASEGMMTTPHRRWVTIMNPTDTASRAYQEFVSGRWNLIQVSALDHPNIAAQLAGRPAPFPAAVQLKWVNDMVEHWCHEVSLVDRQVTDIEWPPDSGKWFRPGPLFESRVLGRWPSQSVDAVWSQAAWQACLEPKELEGPTVIGCDVARFGDDNTAAHVRQGRKSVFHDARNGNDTVATAYWLMSLAKEFAQKGEDPQRILILVDDDGVGGGVVDIGRAAGFNFQPFNAGSSPRDRDGYPNVRSEAWFVSAELAAKRMIDVSGLQPGEQHRLMTQLMAPTYKLNSSGQRVVEPKDKTKKRLKRSPDDADAFNICQYASERSLRMVVV